MSLLRGWSAKIMRAVPPPSTQFGTCWPCRSSSASPCRVRSSSWRQLLKQVLQRGVGFARGRFHLIVAGSQFALRYAVKLRESQDELRTYIGKEGRDVHGPSPALAGHQGVHQLPCSDRPAVGRVSRAEYKVIDLANGYGSSG